MRTGIRFLAVLAVLLLTIGFTGTGSPAPEGQAGASLQSETPLPKMWDPEVSKWSRKSQDQVEDIIKKLQKEIDLFLPAPSLDKKTIRKIAEIYGDNGIFIGHDGLTYRGRREIELYLNTLNAEHKVSNFGIQIKFVYATEFSEAFNNPNGSDEDVVHRVHFILSSSFALDGSHADPPGSTECPHIRVCDCNRSK
jgi:hypothetical protein